MATTPGEIPGVLGVGYCVSFLCYYGTGLDN